MRAVYQALAVVTLGLGFCCAIVGCNSSAVPPRETAGHEKMTGDNMGATSDQKMGDKMGADKMSGDKMHGDKMGGDKMDDGKKDKP